MLLTFGGFIAKKRKELGLSQKELAERLFKEDGKNISPQYLNDIERDRRQPRVDFLIEQLARALNVEEEVLYYLAGEYPVNTRRRADDPETIVKAFRAFRRTLGDKR